MAEFIPTKENITETVTPNVTEVKEQVVGEQVTEQAEAPEVPEQTEQGPGPGDPQYDLWKALSEKKAYTKSYDEFKNKFNSVESVDKLYSKVFENKDYTKTKDDFYNRFFPDLKKNETLSQEPQKPAQIGTTPTSPSQLPSTSTPQGQPQKIQQEPSPIVGQQKPSTDQQPAPELPALEYNDPINLAFKSRKKSGLNFEALVGLDDDNKIQKEIDAARIKADESQKELLNLGYTSSQIKKIQDDSQYLSDDEERATASSLLQADPAGYENYIAFNKALSNLSEADQNKLRQNFNDHNIGVIGIQPGQEKITYTPSIISKVGLIKPQNQGQLFTSLDNLNDYLKQSVDIIDESDAKSEDKQKSKSSLAEAASSYVYTYTTPEDAKNYLSQKMSGEVELKEPQTVADPSGAVNPITMQPFTTQVTSGTFESDPNLDKYEIAAIESKLDPKNEVDLMALDIYKKSIALDDAIKKQSQTIADFRSGDKITDLAVSYYAATNPEIKKVIDSFRDENGRVNRLPNNFVAQLTENFIEDPSVIGSKGYKENNLDLYAKETKNKLYDKYPEYAKDKVAALISQYREDNGYNNFFYNAPTVVDVDESVTRMYKEGLLTKKDVEVYEKSIQPLVMTQIPAISPLQTAGFVERTGKGAIDVLHGGYRTMKSLFSKTGTGKVLMQTDLGYNILSDEMERVNMINDEVIQKLQPNTLHSYIGGTGEFTGMALGLALGGAEFKALGLSLEAAETANLIRAFYGNNYYNAKKLHPGNNAKDLGLTYTSALGNTFIDAFAFKLLPVNKATEGLTRAFKLNTNKLLNGVASGTITEQAAKDSFAKLSGKWALSTMGNAAKSGAVLTGLGAMHELFGKLLGDNHESFVDIGLNAADNLLPNVISSSVVSGFAALGSMNKKISAQDVYDIANNPAFYKDRLNKMEANGADPKLVNDIRQNMDIIVETKTQLNDPEFKDLTEAQKKKYLYLKLQEAVYTRNATSAVDPSIAKKFTEKANDYQKQKDAIINNKDKATEFAREEEPEVPEQKEKIPVEGEKFEYIEEGKKPVELVFINGKWTKIIAGHILRPMPEEVQKVVSDQYTQKRTTYDQKDTTGVSGEVGVGQEPVTTKPVEEAGAEAPTAGGVLQTPGAEGEVKAAGEEVVPTRTEQEVVKSNEEIFDKLYNDLGKQDKAYVDNLLSKGTSKSDLLADPAFDLSMGENPEIKNQYDTNTKELGSIRAKTGAAVEPTPGAAKEQKVEAGVPAGTEPVSGGRPETAPAVLEPKEGDVVELEPQVKGGLPRRMVFKEGEWKQEVGGKTTTVGEPVKAKAQAEFLKQKGAEAKAEPKPTTPEQIIEVKPGELPTKEIKAEVVEEKPLEAKEESLSDIIKKEEEAARKKQQADKDQAKNDIDLIKSGDQATVDKYFQKSGYKEITGNEADTRLKGKQGVYKSTGASITIKKGKAEVALETATNIANKKIQGLSTNRLNQIGIEFEQKKKEAAKQETKPTAEVPEQEVPKTEAKPEAGSVGVGGEVVVSAKPKPIDEQSIAASQKWIKDLYSLPESTRIQDKNGNVYDIVNGKIRKLTLDKEGNVIDAEIIHTDRDVHKRGAYSNPDFFNEGYKVLPEQSLKETPKAEVPTTEAKPEIPKQEKPTEPTKEVEAPEQIKIKEKTKNKLLNFANKHVVQPVVKFSRKLFVADPTESIVDEMNSMGGVNINVNLNEVIKKKGKLNTRSFKRKGVVLKPNVVSVTDFNGKPVLLTISDELTTGEIVNPITGQVLGNLRGGILFNYSKGNTEFAWAYTSEKAASDVLNAAKEMYNKNPELYPDGIVPVAVVKMGKSAMVSNEAVIRQVIQNLTDPKIPEKNKQKAFEVLRGDVKNQLDVVDARINKAKSEGKEPTASDAATSRGYKDVLDLIDNSKNFDDLLNNVNKLNIGTRPLLVGRFTSGDPNIIPAENRMSIDKPATIALMEGLPKSEYKRINLGHLVNNLVDPSLADVPDKHIISFVGIDARADAPVKSKTHPNYPYALKGKGLGVLENTVHVADVMPSAQGNIINKLITAEESGKPVTNEQVISAGLPAGMNNRIFRNKPLSERTSDYNKLVGYLQLAFPNTHFFTDPKTWEAVLDSKDVKKYLKDGEVVYGLTKDGHIYLNPNYDSLNTPIHEAGHLHIDFLETTNPELFNKGISLVEGTGALKDAIKEYGEDGIAARKEALATLIGNKGETITDAAMRSKFQEWLVAVYKYIQSKFPSLKNLTPEQIADLTLDQFVNGSLRDILGAKEVEAPKGKEKAQAEQPKFSKEAPEAQKLAEMKEIVKDLVEDKYSLSEIKDIVTRGINDKSEATIKLIEDAHAEVTKVGGAGVPPTEKAKAETAAEEPEMTKVANAINDAFVEGRFGTEALDNIMSNLQDTSTIDLYNKTKEKIKSGALEPAVIREKVLTQKGGTEADQAALIYDLADLKSRESSLMDQMINETDPKEQKNIANQILDVQTQMQENALANRLIGRSASTIFRLRQMIVNREMDLATMEKQYMSSKGIKELSPEQQKEVKAAYNKIKELSAKLKKTQAEIDSLTVDKDRLKAENERLEKIKAEAKQKEKQDRAKKVSDKISASQERINKAKENIRKLRGDTKVGVDPRIALFIGEIAAEKFYQGAVKFSDLVTAVYEEIKDEFTDWTEDDVKRHLLPDVKPEYFDAEKDYSKSEKDLRAKIEEYKKIQSEYAKTIYEWNKGRRSDLNEKKSWGEKLADNIYAWQRFAVLSYPSTMVKLAAVVGHNLVLKPFRLGFQKVIAKVGGAMSEDFSGKMGVYGDPSLKAMGKYYSEFIRNFSAANLREQFSGIDTKEILYGDKFMFDEWSAGKGLLEMPGRAHGYIKSFVKNPEFVFAHEMITTQYINRMAEASKKLEDPNLSEAERTKAQEEYDNYDVTNEDNLLRINKIALEHGKDAILMGDNAVVDKFRNLTKGSGFWSTFLKTEAPIVKIPLNFINRALLTKYGLFQALTGKSWGTKGTQHPSVAKLIYKGTEGLTDAQGQVLSKVIQYGSMGAALFTLGYLNKNNVTVNDDGSIDVNGFNISKNLVHVPEFESFFSGVETAHKYKDENLNWIESFVISDIDILKKNPFMNLLEYGLIGGSIKAMTDKKMKDENKLKIIEDAATNKLINIAVPGFVKQTAQFLDTKEGKGLHPLGEPIKRRPDPEADWGTRFMQSLELSIPGLRSMVPAVPELYSEKEIEEDKTLSQLSDAGVELPDISRRKFKVLADDKHPEGNMTESEKEQFVSTLKKNYNTMLQSMLNGKWKGTNQTTGEVVYAMGTELGKFKGDIKRNTTELQEMTDDVFNKAWNKTYEQMGFEKAPTTEYSWEKIGAETFSQDELKSNNLLAMYKRLNVDFAEIPPVDELETKKPLTKDEYAKFQKVYKNLVKEKLEELAGKEFVQKIKDIEMDEMVEIEGTEGTMIGQLAKKYDEGDEKKVGKKMSLLQKRVNSIMSGSVNEALQILRYQTPSKSWSEN